MTIDCTVSTPHNIDFTTFAKRKNNTTVVNQDGLLIQFGWGRTSGSGPNVNTMVTFPVAYTNIPIVLVSPGGGNIADTTQDYPGQATSYMDNMQAGANQQSTTGFQVALTRQNGATFNPAHSLFFTWVAIGV